MSDSLKDVPKSPPSPKQYDLFPSDPLSSKHVINLVIVIVFIIISFLIGVYTLYFDRRVQHGNVQETKKVTPSSVK